MEEKLFWISIVSGIFAFILRKASKKEARIRDPRFVAFWHGFFLGLVGLAVARLLAAYWERPDLLGKMMLGLGLGGAALGAVWGWWRGRQAEKAKALLEEDLEWADTGFSSILLAAFIMYVFVQAFKIPSGSMEKTLLIGDHLFVNKLIYGVRVPYTEKHRFRLRGVNRGDVVVFRFPIENPDSPHYGKDFIKRAIGLPGDTVEIRDKKVFINGEALEESYTNFAEDFVVRLPERFKLPPEEVQRLWLTGQLNDAFRDNFGPVTVPPGHYLCLGDNRDRSYDSRFWGPLPEKYLKGKAWFVYWPLSRKKIIK
jgi:signal peptidase I